jgi:DNA protecting protein DprA
MENVTDYLQLHNIKGIGPKRYHSIVVRLQECRLSLDQLFAMPVEAIVKEFKLPINVAKAIVASSVELKLLPNKADNEMVTLRSKGIKILKKGTPEYPQRLLKALGNSAPETLYVWGNLDLLNKPAVGFCGSRNVSEKGIEITIDTAKQIAELGWIVVSGHARGVDTAAHKTALEANCGTIIVAAEGVLGFKLREELKKISKPDQLLIVSEFNPNAKWTVINAMTRNKTIIGLSDAMILVEARTEGGTFEAGKAALRLKKPLYVVDYQTADNGNAGNHYLLKRGAKPLRRNKETIQANISDLREVVNMIQSIPEASPKQTTKQLELM